MLTGQRRDTWRNTTPILTSVKSKVQQRGNEDCGLGLAILVEHKVSKQRDPKDIGQMKCLGLKLSRRIQIDPDNTALAVVSTVCDDNTLL